ncbi:DUF695 domain-containing protein [Hymenobacter sp. NST-14]|uniref:DUF695 domain-containing protein n=1 Tax=Hymenobacter piscis TaxID=2839984 RepID=UPI001C036291|nr:DUF695 domain-containing protein [Hymenobacter piscis]MBT9394683.1 DUF695 domain-containing protein [Hymenobacter piscis]
MSSSIMNSNLTKSYQDFWVWFQKKEKTFFLALQEGKHIEQAFFDKLSPKLDIVKEGFYFLAGMADDKTAELVLTADGVIQNIVFVEELVRAAPAIAGWKFTALKAASYMDEVNIKMAGYTFNVNNINFYSADDTACPDEVNIIAVHDDLEVENTATISNGVGIFLDNYLGELDFATEIDNVTVISPSDAQQPLIPIGKLKDFLAWRKKEFTERYEGIRHNTEDDEYASFEAELADDKRLVAVMNTDLLAWDAKASHPWILLVEIPYDGERTNGMPDEETYELLNQIEESILTELKDSEGYLNVGRQTADGVREIYFACNDFRKPAKVLYQIQADYSTQLAINYDIYKDKYWQSFARFASN